MAIKHYILTWLFTDDLKTEIVVYGPFKTQKEAAKYGRKWSKEHDDSPCWNTVDLFQEDTLGDHIRRILAVGVLPKWEISEPSIPKVSNMASEPLAKRVP